MRHFVPWVMLLALFAVAVVDGAYHYPLLPERIASHFGPSGRADGWMDKDAFLLFTGTVTLFVLGMCLLPSRLLRALPAETINLPNKEYWLDPERREATMMALSHYFLSMSVATLALPVSLMHLTYRANLSPEPTLGGASWILLAGYLAYVGVWSVSLLRRFVRKHE